MIEDELKEKFENKGINTFWKALHFLQNAGYNEMTALVNAQYFFESEKYFKGVVIGGSRVGYSDKTTKLRLFILPKSEHPQRFIVEYLNTNDGLEFVSSDNGFDVEVVEISINNEAIDFFFTKKYTEEMGEELCEDWVELDGGDVEIIDEAELGMEDFDTVRRRINEIFGAQGGIHDNPFENYIDYSDINGYTRRYVRGRR